MKNDSKPSKKLNNLFMPVVLSITLGLAPFVPEPHVWGKIKWVAGGAVGMQPMDYFDLVLHGAPWVWMVWMVVRSMMGR